MKASERVVVYGSLGLRKGISDLLWAFRKSNKMEEFPAYLDDHPFQIMERIRNEVKAGMRTADVILMPHYAVMAIGKDGLLSEVDPPSATGPRTTRGTGATPVGVSFMAMAYNTKSLKPQEVPENLEALADPRWRGALGTQSLTSSRSGNLGVWYLSFLRRAAGESAWRAFIAGLAHGNRPVAYDCIDHLLQGILGGEAKLGLTVYSLAYFREKTAGSPIALVGGEKVPHMMTFTSAALVKGSEENGPARRFVEFLLTPSAQEIIGSIPGIAPIAHGLNPSYDFEHLFDGRTSFHPDARDFEEVPSAIELFRKMGLP